MTVGKGRAYHGFRAVNEAGTRPGSRAQMAESTQKKISRVRKPRVHITYDVETGGAIEMKELPFVVGVLADLSGQPVVDEDGKR